jgi:hypothetical protein
MDELNSEIPCPETTLVMPIVPIAIADAVLLLGFEVYW